MRWQLIEHSALMIAVGVLVMFSTSSCASTTAVSDDIDYIDKMTKEHAYEQPCDQVWPVASKLLFRQGYVRKDAKHTMEGSTRVMETQWITERLASRQRSERHVVRGIKPGEGRCKIHFIKYVRSTEFDGVNTSRDLSLEWELLKEVDWQRAYEIRQEADTRLKAASRD